ncbi:cytochrome C biogenesis protein [Lysobacter maris]|uniref:Cytochrome C biogenesis protein n=2 Tax=Marilutibacter maris TaxID=1605891 RepID=A0A2U9TG05_9GAMM|nr:cytochrome C biogenesis protein [Lysobacter maris]
MVMDTPIALFIALAATLAVVALGYVLRPLWRGARGVGATLLIALVVLTGTVYTMIGTPEALDPARRAAPQTLDDAITQLEIKLDQDPAQPEGWRLLAGAYASKGNLEEASKAYARAVQHAPDDPDLLAEAAEARAMAAPQRRFDAKAVSLLERAIALQPMHQRARWFLGIAHRQSEQPAEAVKVWEPLLDVVDARTAAALREQIDLARQEAGLPPLPAAEPAVETAPTVTVAVSLDPQLGMQLPAGATLFVIARQPGGSPMPVAVKKLPVTQFPLTVGLGDGDSPMPTMKLSQLQHVELIARISASGNAMPASGDFASQPVRIDTGKAASAALLIDQVVP